MSLNSLTIETLSICTVKESIVLSDYLKPFINENDKEPSWDGFVYIYKDKNCSKENLKGRLAIQVKGKEHKDLTKEEISYSMSTVDLRNYLYDGGVILFVVYLAENGTKKKIYYCELPPIKLRILLAEAKEQQTKTIKLKQFPDDNNKKATIFLNCLENCQKQASFSNATLLSLEEIEKEGLLEGVTVPITAVGIEDPQTALLNNEVYVYAKIKGSAIPQPLEMIPMDMRTYETQAASIKIDEKQFYTQFQRVRSASSTKCILGESFVIQSENSTSPCKITYKNSNKVRVLAKDLDFMLSYLEKGYFLLNGVEMPFDYDGADLSNFNIEEQKERLQTAKNIVKLLDILNCQKDIDMSTLSTQDWSNLDKLIQAFVYHEKLTGLNPDLPLIQGLTIGDLRFIICPKKVEGEAGAYYFYDFFKTEIQVSFESQTGEQLPISQYFVLKTSELISVDNLRCDAILPSFKKIEKHKETFNRANWFMLDLISAYDLSCRQEFINTAKDFSEWILSEDNEDIPLHIKRLNHLQIIKRIREFSLDEIRELYLITEDSSATEQVLVGAYLLLGQQAAADIHFEKLTSEEKEEFKTFPIYRFSEND